MKVKPKKHLGQHFLRDLDASERIADLLSGHGGYDTVLEIGPGMGVLTQFILPKTQYQTYVVEIDRESVAYLKVNFPTLEGRIIDGDFLRMNLQEWGESVTAKPAFAIIGNYPYNISSQILFKALDYRDTVSEIVGMFQKEVAMRIASPPGKKDYGILSVLLQAFYDIEYSFTVPPEAFEPPPKVQSGVIRLKRNAVTHLDCDEKKFKQVVKAGFNQRRKTLRNALKSLGIQFDHPLLDKRAEQLGVAEFVLLTNLVNSPQSTDDSQ
ncbi:16S rRNA (adenine(1518)-N(6)/adenine(1519)-N(6))-dimethyltransferase RsmA [Runella sp.]|uniref:16S rRNA (adenine(1518)-N(6)/adenine(1519)-N(6))- dimethyltransferase RsmA n=1 Tax=Runella sp. TaxID=1960881 RepID=UPI0026175F99|nr:16S rRNA (adenine(1518)-N(6)/adenine(1519)-N(6))-dimethyltransferase RsmA [Runella sp.]